MKHLIAIGSGLLIISACSSLLKKNEEVTLTPAPASGLLGEEAQSNNIDPKSLELYVASLSAQNPDKPTQWWAQYTIANLRRATQPEDSCVEFAKLADDNEFPLKSLAQIRKLETCPLTTDHLPQPENLPAWAQGAFVDVGLKVARKTQKPGLLTEFLVKKAQNLPESTRRIDFLNEALKVAEKNGMQAEISKIELIRETLAPRFRKTPKKGELLEVADDHKKAREFSKARLFYQHLVFDPKTPLELKRQAIKGIRSSYKLENDKSNFLKSSEQLVRFHRSQFLKDKKDPKIAENYYEAMMSLARAQWTQGQKRLTRQTLSQVEQIFRRRLPLTEIDWLRGRLEEEDSRFLSAVRWAERGLKTDPGGELREKLLWQKGWNLYKVGSYQAAAEALGQLAQTTSSPFEKLKAQFWRARSLKGLGLEQQAKSEFQQILDQDPIGYYGIVASRELGVSFSAKSIPMPSSPAVTPQIAGAPMSRTVANQNASILLDWLVAVGEWNVAQDFLQHLQQVNPALFDGSAESALFMAKAGRFEALLQRAATFPAETRRMLLNENAEMMFPRPYRERVEQSAQQFGISPEFIYSIIRQESSFNRHARSIADAYGLMQLLPETAHKASARAGIRIQDPEDLYDPEVNIPLGTAHLRNLWDGFQGQFLLTVAGYNASREAVLNWVKTRYRTDALEFIEDIPYEETRSYVKLVLRNLVFYSALGHTGPIPFPEWCLKGLQNFKS